MPHYTEYVCSECGAECSREEANRGELVRKIVQFLAFGPRPRIVKSITIKFLCKGCMTKDSDYKRPSHRGPGQRSGGLERVRVAQELVARGGVGQ